MNSDTGTEAGVDEPTPAVVPVKRRRTSFGEYLTMALGAWSPGVEITPAWVRQVTGCSRGLSSRLAAAARAEVDHSAGDGDAVAGAQVRP